MRWGAPRTTRAATPGPYEPLLRSLVCWRPDDAATQPAKVICARMSKQTSGQPLTPAEQQTLDYYIQPSLDQMLLGGMPRVSRPGFPPSPQARPRVMTPPRAPARQSYSRTATNPKTGERMGLTPQGQWVPIR